MPVRVLSCTLLCATVLLLVVLFPPVLATSWIDTVYTAEMRIGDVSPVPHSRAHGVAVCTLERNARPRVLDCEVQHDIVTPLLSAGIYVGERRNRGRLLYEFPLTEARTTHKNFRHTFLVDDIGELSAFQQERDFRSGLWFIRLASEEFPNGELRGQLEHKHRFFSRLSSEYTVPIASGTTSVGLAVGKYKDFDPIRSLTPTVLHNVDDPIAAQHREGAFGVVGKVLFNFKRYESPMRLESFSLTKGEERDIFDDEHYLVVNSRKNPDGAIRGQWEGIDPYPEVAFTMRLEGRQNLPPVNTLSRGAGLFTYDCDSRLLEYLVVHNSDGAFRVSMHVGDPGLNGAAIWDLARVQSPIFGSRVLTPQEEFVLYSQQMYVLVSSTFHPTGEIRGQIGIEFDFWAYLSGTWVPEPVSTASIGVGVFQVGNRTAQEIRYSIHHDVFDVTGVDMSIGSVGEGSSVDIEMRRALSPIIGNDQYLDDDELDQFLSERMYVRVRSLAYPNGELRGQIKRIQPCLAQGLSSLTVDETLIVDEESVVEYVTPEPPPPSPFTFVLPFVPFPPAPLPPSVEADTPQPPAPTVPPLSPVPSVPTPPGPPPIPTIPVPPSPVIYFSPPSPVSPLSPQPVPPAPTIASRPTFPPPPPPPPPPSPAPDQTYEVMYTPTIVEYTPAPPTPTRIIPTIPPPPTPATPDSPPPAPPVIVYNTDDTSLVVPEPPSPPPAPAPGTPPGSPDPLGLPTPPEGETLVTIPFVRPQAPPPSPPVRIPPTLTFVDSPSPIDIELFIPSGLRTDSSAAALCASAIALFAALVCMF